MPTDTDRELAARIDGLAVRIDGLAAQIKELTAFVHDGSGVVRKELATTREDLAGFRGRTDAVLSVANRGFWVLVPVALGILGFVVLTAERAGEATTAIRFLSADVAALRKAVQSRPAAPAPVAPPGAD